METNGNLTSTEQLNALYDRQFEDESYGLACEIAEFVADHMDDPNVVELATLMRTI